MERMVWPTVQVGTVGIVSRGGQLHSGTIIATEAICASFSSAANIVAAVALATAAIAGCNTSSTSDGTAPTYAAIATPGNACTIAISVAVATFVFVVITSSCTTFDASTVRVYL